MTITPVSRLVEIANAQVEILSAAEALRGQQQDQNILIDIRDIRELDRDGRVKGAVHAPRGMLEFWFDPASQYHREVFADPGKKYVLFCAGGMRSALAAKTLQDMGFTNIAHVEGGFAALRASGAEVEQRPK